jgi:hypothetical protein
MNAKLLTVAEILDMLRYGGKVLKYVRVGYEYRFTLGGDNQGPQHKEMLDPEDKVVSAGFCIIEPKNRTVSPFSKSLTLNLEPAPDDAERLTALFFGNGLYKPESGSIMPK